MKRKDFLRWRRLLDFRPSEESCFFCYMSIPANASDLPPRLALWHVTKRYPGVVANNDISLTVKPGEIHAVLGENGAG